jgi:hypothetical protein
MNVRRHWVVASTLCLAAIAGCSGLIEPSGAAPTQPSTETVATTTTTTTVAMTFEPGATVPDAPPGAAGCIEEPGTLRAPASAWYHSGSAADLTFSGEVVESATFGDFGKAVDTAVQHYAQLFVADSGYELAKTADSCVTYRSAQFVRKDGAAIVVSTWRAEGAADPSWIPTEVPFSSHDDATLIADGLHIRVALVVAPDGTSVRVSAYGVGELQAVSGWPSTTVATSPISYGDAPATTDEIVSIGKDVLTYSLQR